MAEAAGFGPSAIGQIAAAAAALASRGVAMVEEPHIIAKMAAYDLWMAFFRDSEGNMHALMSEVERR